MQCSGVRLWIDPGEPEERRRYATLLKREMADKDLERKKEELKVKEKETAVKMVHDEQKHQHKVEESKLPAKKTETKK